MSSYVELTRVEASLPDGESAYRFALVIELPDPAAGEVRLPIAPERGGRRSRRIGSHGGDGSPRSSE
jgi:hypothetical protein